MSIQVTGFTTTGCERMRDALFKDLRELTFKNSNQASFTTKYQQDNQGGTT